MTQNLNNKKMNKMRQLYIIGLIALAGIIIGLAWAEQISLTAYYPAPYGVYKQMRLYPRDDLDPTGACSDKGEGALYYDDSDSELYYCDGTDWQTFKCPSAPPPPTPVPGPWVYLGTPVLTNAVIPSGYGLDLSSLVGGARQVVVLLKVKTNSTWGWYFYTKPFADPDAYSLDNMHFPMNALHFTGPNKYQLLMVHTDSNGKVGIRVGGMFNPTWDVILVGYLPP